MRAAFVLTEYSLCDELSSGMPAIKKLSCSIFLAASYCRKQGLQVDVFLLKKSIREFDYQQYDIVVAWVPLWEGFYEAISYLEEAKAAGKKTAMILNDPLESLEMEAMERFSYIDYIIRHWEREWTLGYLLGELVKGHQTDFPSKTGLIYRENGRVIDTGIKPPFPDMKHMPSTAEFLRNIEIEKYREVFIETGRGCPFLCTFCFYNRTTQKKRDFKDLIDEARVVGTRVPHVWLHDLNMLANRKWTNELCDALIESGVKINWGTDARVDECANLDLLKKMRRSGCYLLTFGIESADEGILKKIDKRINFDLLDKALENCKIAGIRVELNLMYGFPWDNHETMQKTAAFIKKYPVLCIMLVRPQRGTPLYEEYKKLGIIKKDMTLDDYVYCRKYPAFPTLHLSKDEIYKWHKKFEILASRYSFKRKIQEEGAFHAIQDWVRLKGFKLLNPKKIVDQLFVR